MSVGTAAAEVSVDEVGCDNFMFRLGRHYVRDRDLLCRAKGWAVRFGVLLLDTSLVDHPRHAVMGEKILRRITKDEPVLRGDSGK